MSVWIYVECYFPLYGWLWIIIILPFMSGLDFYSAPPTPQLSVCGEVYCLGEGGFGIAIK